MRDDDEAVLDLWGRVSSMADDRRLHELVAAAAADDGQDADVGTWPLGRAHAALLRLHATVAGPRLDSTVACPACGERIEFALAVADLLARAEDAPPTAPVEHDGWHVTWSPLTLGQFVDAGTGASPDAAAAALLEGVVESAKAPDGRPASARDLPPAVVAAVAAAQAASDPLLEVLAELRCSGCQQAVTAEVRLAEHVASAIEARAVRLLDDVHDLALAYGWHEQEVLALAPQRRQAYLERIRAGAP